MTYFSSIKLGNILILKLNTLIYDIMSYRLADAIQECPSIEYRPITCAKNSIVLILILLNSSFRWPLSQIAKLIWIRRVKRSYPNYEICVKDLRLYNNIIRLSKFGFLAWAGRIITSCCGSTWKRASFLHCGRTVQSKFNCQCEIMRIIII